MVSWRTPSSSATAKTLNLQLDFSQGTGRRKQLQDSLTNTAREKESHQFWRALAVRAAIFLLVKLTLGYKLTTNYTTTLVYTSMYYLSWILRPICCLWCCIRPHDEQNTRLNSASALRMDISLCLRPDMFWLHMHVCIWEREPYLLWRQSGA